jgi:hypothetical protein
VTSSRQEGAAPSADDVAALRRDVESLRAQVSGLTSQLQRLADIEAIRRLTCDYAYYNDILAGEPYADCFTPEGFMDATQCDPNIMVHRGRKEIRAVNEAVWEHQAHPRTDGGACIHMQLNHRVTVLRGDYAEGTVYFVAWGLSNSGQRSEFIGRYEDKYARTPGGWKFTERVLVPLMPTSSADYKLTEDDVSGRLSTQAGRDPAS